MYLEFAGWLDQVLDQSIPIEVVSFVFNLYEGRDSFDVQLAGCPTFEPESDEWAVGAVFTTGEELWSVPRVAFDDEWSLALFAVRQLIEQYMAQGAQSEKLREALGVAIGFVDGDLEIVHQAK